MPARIAGLLAGGLLAAVLAVGAFQDMNQDRNRARSDQFRTVQFSYVDPPEGPGDFLEKSEVAFFGTPVGPEVILQDQDADSPIQIVGQNFVVSKPIKGAVDAPAVMVIRTHLVGATVQDQPPFTHPLYFLGLQTTQDSYGVPAWYTIGGPSGRIPFEPTQTAGEYLSVIESEGNQIQAALEGLTPEQLIEALSP